MKKLQWYVTCPSLSLNDLETLQQLSAHVITLKDKQRQTFLQEGFQTCSVLTLNAAFDIMSYLCNRLRELQPLGHVMLVYRINIFTLMNVDDSLAHVAQFLHEGSAF